MNYLSDAEITKLLNIEDLTENVNHAIGLSACLLRQALEAHFKLPAYILKSSPIVEKKNNFDLLNYSPDEASLSEVYTKYVSDTKLFRTQMTALIPPALMSLNSADKNNHLLLAPGMVYRRDVVDRTHVGQPHQMDVWFLSKEPQSRKDLLAMVDVIVGVLSKIVGKKINYRYNETSHNYTKDGIEVEINYQGKWLEILECGLACPELLEKTGMSAYSGLALGMGLDRFVMLAKNVQDIRMLRASDPRIANQMHDLKPFRLVSKMPSTKRDLSMAINVPMTFEELTEQVMSFLGEKAEFVEEMKLLSATKYKDLPEHVSSRLGMTPNQENWLVRLELRHPSKTLSAEEGNELYTEVYDKFHQGAVGYSIVA